MSGGSALRTPSGFVTKHFRGEEYLMTSKNIAFGLFLPDPYFPRLFPSLFFPQYSFSKYIFSGYFFFDLFFSRLFISPTQ